MKSKKLLVICSSFIAIVLGLVLAKSIVAQETPEEIAAKHGVTFPISELGGCKNYLECRTYCEDPVNQDKCIDFAKEKGFYKEEEFQVGQTMLARARTVLGCTSSEACRSFCEKQENFDKCHQFAQSVGVVGGYKEDPRSGEFLNKAKEFLGCTSYETCRNFCDNPANRDKCAEFARKIGISGGYEYKGPGGCTTEETCREFCTNPTNFEICKQFAQAHGGSFGGPGGCTDEDSCRAYCEKNPSSCPGFGGAQGSPAEYCSKTPGCSWTGSTCQCSSTGTYGGDPATECKKYNCSWTGTYCQCGNTEDYQQKWQSECTKYPGCSWTNNSCQCTTTGQTPYPSQTYSPTYTPYPTSGTYSTPTSGGTYDPATECAKQTGCSWTGTTCQCSSSGGESSSGSTESTTQPSYDPATECSKYPGCSWTGTTCQCQSVQGASTEGLLQKFLQFLLK